MKPVDKNMPATPMPASDAGITGGTNGSVGDASTSDLRRGFTDAGASEQQPGLVSPYEDPPGGFLNRPHGWER